MTNCPIRLPFGIKIVVYGAQTETRFFPDYPPGTGSKTVIYPSQDIDDPFNIWVDPTNASCHCSMAGETLTCMIDTTFASGGIYGNTGDFSAPYILIMKFDTNSMSVDSLSISFSGSINDQRGHQAYLRRTVNIMNIHYTSDTLFIADKDLQSHFVTAIDVSSWAALHNDWDQIVLETPSLVSVSGFHYSSPASQTVRATPLDGTTPFSVHSDHGALQCSFAPTDHPMILETYSTIGARIGRFEIAHGQQTFSIPPLPRGLYFLRLGEEVSKIFVSE